MHIWAGSGSAGKETVRRRSRTPKKTAKSIRKEKRSARVGLGMDDSCSDDIIGYSSLSPGLSLKKDSGIDCEMVAEALANSAAFYDVEQDMVKPLNVGSLDSTTGSINTIGRIEDGLKELRKEEIKIVDELEAFSTPKKSKGKGIALVDLDDPEEDSTWDFTQSLFSLDRMLASTDKIPRAENEENIQGVSPTKVSDGDVFLAPSQVGISPKDLPPRHTAGLTQVVNQHPVVIESVNDLGSISSPGQASKHDKPDEPSFCLISPEIPQTISEASSRGINSSESENELEKIFSKGQKQVSEPGTPHGRLQGEHSSDVAKAIINAPISEPGTLDEYPPDKDPIPDTKPLRNTLDASQEKRRNATIGGFSLLVPHIVREAKDSLYITPSRFSGNDTPSSSAEGLGEVTSLKEIEFCASGLKNHVTDELEVEGNSTLGNLELNVGNPAQMEDDHILSSLEGFSSNLGSPMSLSVMGSRESDPFTSIDVEVGSCSRASVDCSAKAKAENDEKSTCAQESDRLLQEFKVRYPLIKGDEPLPSYDASVNSIEAENECDIERSEAFSPVHQNVIASMTPKHDYVERRSQRVRDTNNLLRGGIFLESKYPHDPARGRAASQPSRPGMNWFPPRSRRPSAVNKFEGTGSEEWLLGKGDFSESETEMRYEEPEGFWMQDSEGKMTGTTKTNAEMETEAETDEEGQYLLAMDRKMKKRNPGLFEPMFDENDREFMGISQYSVDGSEYFCIDIEKI